MNFNFGTIGYKNSSTHEPVSEIMPHLLLSVFSSRPPVRRSLTTTLGYALFTGKLFHLKTKGHYIKMSYY